jgi:hypothetical protein
LSSSCAQELKIMRFAEEERKKGKTVIKESHHSLPHPIAS